MSAEARSAGGHWTSSLRAGLDFRATRPFRRLLAVGAVLALAGCQADELGYGPKHQRPLSYAIKADMTAKGMKPEDPIFVRLFKEDSSLEVWKRTKTGKYDLLKTYDICKWSGELGPKKKEGDRQAPEGFYTIRPAQMNPNSSYHLSFDMGFPNAYDRALERTGTHLMVHGACSSRGCYAMTDEQIQEIYTLAREAFRGGQREFQLQALPFRMTPENMAKHANNENMPFWRMLKVGYDHFEVTRQVPKVDVCGKTYVFDAKPEDENARFVGDRQCPAYSVPETIARAVAEKQKIDEQKTTMIIAQLDAKRQREEKWKAGDTGLAKLFGGGSQAPAPDAPSTPADPALAYAPNTNEPVPATNPARPAAEAGKPNSGFFSNLFKGDAAATAAPVSPVAPTPPNVPEVTAPSSADSAEATAPAAAEGETVAEEASEPARTRVSDFVSRFFGGRRQ